MLKSLGGLYTFESLRVNDIKVGLSYLVFLVLIIGFFSSLTPQAAALSNPLSCQQSCRLSMIVSGPSSYVGFSVDISGNVTGPDNAPAYNQTVYVYSRFKADPGIPMYSWVVIAIERTDTVGGFSFQWIPTVTGDFIVRGSLCNYPYVNCIDGSVSYHPVPSPSGPIDVSLSVLPAGNQQLVSVASNSTISSMNFNATSHVLAFQLSGASGTTAWVQVSIAKSMLSDPNSLQLRANSATIPFQAQSSRDQWTIVFTVHFASVMNISMVVAQPSPGGLGIGVLYSIFGLFFAAGVIVVLLRRQWFSQRLRPVLSLVCLSETTTTFNGNAQVGRAWSSSHFWISPFRDAIRA